MSLQKRLPTQNKFTLAFEDENLEREFRNSYDKSVKLPLRYGIIISILSWYSSIWLVYSLIPDQLYWLAPLTLINIGVFFGFIVTGDFHGYTDSNQMP